MALAFFLAAASCVHPEAASWNVTARLATVQSLVDRGTFAIDRSEFKTGDEYRYSGHFYSDKPIVLSLVGAGVVELLRALHIDIVPNRRLLLAVLTITTVSLPFGIAIAALAELLRILGTDDRASTAIAVIAGSATLAFPYATVFINHVPAATCLLIGLVFVVRSSEVPAFAMCGGIAFALAVGIDSSYIVFLLLAPLAIGRASARHYLSFASGACSILAALAIADVRLSGDVRPPDTNASLYAYPGSSFAHGYVLGSIGDRSIQELSRYAFAITFGERGLFFYSPILLIAVHALVRGLRSPSSPIEVRVLGFVAVASALYIASVVLGTTDYGGDAYGLRRFVGISLLLCLALKVVWNELRSDRRARTIFLCVLAFSLAITGLGVRDPLVTGVFPARDAIPILIAYGRTHVVEATVHVLLVSVLASVAFYVVYAALRPNDRRRGMRLDAPRRWTLAGSRESVERE